LATKSSPAATSIDAAGIDGCATNREVDAFRWLEPTDAFDVLSYEHDRGVLEAFRFPLDRSRLAAS
jgi:hypothetical protein